MNLKRLIALILLSAIGLASSFTSLEEASNFNNFNSLKKQIENHDLKVQHISMVKRFRSNYKHFVFKIGE